MKALRRPVGVLRKTRRITTVTTDSTDWLSTGHGGIFDKQCLATVARPSQVRIRSV
jgi:hypothetical protein